MRRRGERGKGIGREETRSIYLLNVFRAFVGEGEGLSRSHGKYEALKRVLPNPAREGIATIPTGYRRINEGSLP